MQMESKSYVVIMFGKYVRIKLQKHVRIMSGSSVRFMSGNYVIKPCKWEQKILNHYVMAHVIITWL